MTSSNKHTAVTLFLLIAPLATTADAGWIENGVPVRTESGDQQFPQLIPDGTGGAIITWHDWRPGFDWPKVCAQRIDEDGNIIWIVNGIAVCIVPEAGEQLIPGIAPDGSGGAIITWADERPLGMEPDIYAQRIDPAGTSLWAAGGAIVTWHRLEGGGYDVYAMRVCENVAPTATALQGVSTILHGAAVRIEWTLSAPGEIYKFYILRIPGDVGEFEELTSPEIIKNGMTFTFRDEYCQPAATYRYRVDVLDETGRKVLFETGPVEVPARPLTLYRNFPNPFNPCTSIRYYLPEDGHVTLEIFDVSGRLIAGLVDGNQSRGMYNREWNGTGDNNGAAGSGIYFCRLRLGKETVTGKIVLTR